MKHFFLLLAATLAVFLALPACAQTGSAGWKTQIKADGAKTFTPPDLRAGESYSVTVYDETALDGKSLEAYLRAFAGPIGTGTGKLAAPLSMGVNEAQSASATGTYRGPNGAQLTAAFNAFSLDGGRTVAVSRVLTSGDALFFRYQKSYQTLIAALVQRAQGEAGANLVSVPARVMERLKPGGALVPGIYAGNQFSDEELKYQLRLYIYPSGGYRFKNEKNEDFQRDAGVGTVSYKPASGQLDLDVGFDMIVGSDAKRDFCFYGRNAAGKPAIYAENDIGFHTARTSLVWVAPLSANSSPRVIQAREAAQKAEDERYKFVTAPGQGVKAAQIQAITRDSSGAFGGMGGWIVTETLYLLLKDGTVHRDLPVPPDQLDLAASRAGEPKAWGKWRKTAKGYEVSWAGGAFETLPGKTTIPGAPQTRLAGRYAAVRADMYSHEFWGVTFGKDGRFSKDRRGAVGTGNFGGMAPQVTTTWDEGGSGTVVTGGGVDGPQGIGASVKTRKPGGDRAGTYSIDGYTLTLRYDNGQIARLPFFFTDAGRKKVWFEGDTLELGLDD